MFYDIAAVSCSPDGAMLGGVGLWDGGKKYCPSNGLPTAVNKGQLFWNAK